MNRFAARLRALEQWDDDHDDLDTLPPGLSHLLRYMKDHGITADATPPAEEEEPEGLSLLLHEARRGWDRTGPGR